VTSGIRLGTPAGTTRGFNEKEFRQIGELILQVFDGLKQSPDGNEVVEKQVRSKIAELCEAFPIY
jgi:glycine hydroxymethyltransferase